MTNITVICSFQFSVSFDHKISYAKKKKENTVFATLITLIEEKPDPSQICSIPQRRVMENWSFLVDTSNLKYVNFYNTLFKYIIHKHNT